MVSKELVILAKCLKELDGGGFNLLEERIVAQKRIYLLQECGLDLGYRFAWDLYGPYSSDFARDLRLYDLEKAEVDALAGKIRLNKEGKELMRRLRTLMAVPQIQGQRQISAEIWLEVLATLHFLISEMKQAPPTTGSLEANELKELLYGRKPHLRNQSQVIDQALAVLPEYCPLR